MNTVAIANMPNLCSGNLRIMPLADNPYSPQAKKHNAMIMVIIYGKPTPKFIVHLFIMSVIP